MNVGQMTEPNGQPHTCQNAGQATPPPLGLVELKCVGEWAKLEWGPDEDPDAPEKFYYQCQVQMGVTGLRKTWLAAVFGGNRPRFDFVIDFDPEFFGAWLVVARKLWQDIQAGRAPDVTASDSSAQYLRAKYPRPEREELPPAPVEALGWAERYLAAGEAIAPLEREQKEAKHLLEDAIGKAGAPGLMLEDNWPVTWKPRKDGARVFSLRRRTINQLGDPK